MTLSRLPDGTYSDGSVSRKRYDSIIFDCDGVLVDVSESYDEAIRRSAQHILKECAGITHEFDDMRKTIDSFKKTGGFNDEIDLAYALVLCVYAAKQSGISVQRMIDDAAKNADHTGIRSVQAFLANIPDASEDITNLVARLEYPGSGSIMVRVFDNLFYGPVLYEKLFGKKPGISCEPLIERDLVMLDKTLLDTLLLYTKNIAIVTGRGYESARHSLRDLLDGFNLDASEFLEDQPRERAKPNPRPLYDSVSAMNSAECLYIGDSMEDYIMARAVSSMGRHVTFCGILGCPGASGDEARDARLCTFSESGVSLALDSIRDLPKILGVGTCHS